MDYVMPCITFLGYCTSCWPQIFYINWSKELSRTIWSSGLQNTLSKFMARQSKGDLGWYWPVVRFPFFWLVSLLIISTTWSLVSQLFHLRPVLLPRRSRVYTVDQWWFKSPYEGEYYNFKLFQLIDSYWRCSYYCPPWSPHPQLITFQPLCHNRDQTHPCSPYPDLSTPFPRHQKPSPSTSCHPEPTRILTMHSRTLCPPCISSTYPQPNTPSTFCLLASNKFLTPTPIPDLMLFNLLFLHQVYSQRFLSLATVVRQSPITYLPWSICPSLSFPRSLYICSSFRPLYISLCLIVHYPTLASWQIFWWSEKICSSEKIWLSENDWLSDDLNIWEKLISQLLRIYQTFQNIRGSEHQIISNSQITRQPVSKKAMPSDIIRNFQKLSDILRLFQTFSDH